MTQLVITFIALALTIAAVLALTNTHYGMGWFAFLATMDFLTAIVILLMLIAILVVTVIIVKRHK